MSFSKRTLRFEEDRCDYWYGNEGIDAVASVVGALHPSQFLVVCDTHVAQLYGKTYVGQLSEYAPTMLLTHDNSETGKTLSTVEALGNEALRCGADRQSVVVAVGGGLTGNIAGLLATLLFRGVRLVHVPTTLLAMVDSVFSQKQAVNSQYGKNAFGAFCLPELIVADMGHIATLPAADIHSSMCEVIKNAVAIQPDYIDELHAALDPGAAYGDDALTSIIDFSIISKQTVMESDRYEKGPALICEYGHTTGHALEYVGGIAHGLAIGIGMLVAAEISAQRGGLDRDAVGIHYKLMERNGCFRTPVGEMIANLDIETVLNAAMFDNKRGYMSIGSDSVAMVLLEELGRPFEARPGLPLVAAAKDEIRDALKRVRDHASLGAPGHS